MASVTLTTLWLQSAADLTDAIAVPYMAALTVTPSVDGEVRDYANGRQRLIRRSGKSRAVSVSLPFCSRLQVDWLEAHLGQTVLIRDDRGRTVWAVYLAAPTAERSGHPDLADVSLDLAEISY